MSVLSEIFKSKNGSDVLGHTPSPEYDPQAGGFSNGTLHGGDGSYNRWTLAEFRKQIAELVSDAAALTLKESETGYKLRGMLINGYANTTVMVGGLEFTGAEAIDAIQQRIQKLTLAKENIDNQLQDPNTAEISISDQAAYHIQRRMGDEVTVRQRADGTYYLDRADAAKVSERLGEKIRILEADRQSIEDCEHEGEHGKAPHTVSREAHDAILEDQVAKGKQLDTSVMTDEQKKTVAEICTAREAAGEPVPDATCSAVASDVTLGGPALAPGRSR